MRSRLVAPVVLAFFITAACGGKEGSSQVEGGSAANGNGTAGGFTLGNGSGSGNGTGSSTGGDGNAFDPNSACATTSADGEPVPVDLYFMVDTTGSMDCPVPDNGPCDMPPPLQPGMESRWTVVSAALKAFIADPANSGLGVGIRFFPVADMGGRMGGGGNNNNATCSVASYLAPTVEISPLPGSAAALTSAINMQSPSGTTPTVPSITAALTHATTWALANPSHRVAVVYATDGYPNGCNGNTIQAAAALAKQGFDSNPSIPTYVLGVGPNLANLEQIAASGSNGKTKAFLVDTTQNAAAQLSTALASIRSNAVLDCTYTIPAPPKGQTFQPGQVNVDYTSSKGVTTSIKQDPQGVACSAGSGWQYSADGKQINLCGAACNAVKADPGGKMQVLFGCATQVGNPPK